MNSKLSIAIASILGSVSFGAVAADQAGSTSDVNSDTLQEITVTATRRSQSMQDVPIAMQAFTGQALAATQHLDIRRLHQIFAERHLGEQRPRTK